MLGREGLLVSFSGEGASLSHLCFKSHQVVSVAQAPPSAPALGPSSAREAAAAWGPWVSAVASPPQHCLLMQPQPGTSIAAQAHLAAGDLTVPLWSPCYVLDIAGAGMPQGARQTQPREVEGREVGNTGVELAITRGGQF